MGLKVEHLLLLLFFLSPVLAVNMDQSSLAARQSLGSPQLSKRGKKTITNTYFLHNLVIHPEFAASYQIMNILHVR